MCFAVRRNLHATAVAIEAQIKICTIDTANANLCCQIATAEIAIHRHFAACTTALRTILRHRVRKDVLGGGKVPVRGVRTARAGGGVETMLTVSQHERAVHE
jgi:hypothetical protein